MVLAEGQGVSATQLDGELLDRLPFDHATPDCLTVSEIATWSGASVPAQRQMHIHACPFCTGLLVAMDRTVPEHEKQFVDRALALVHSARHRRRRRPQVAAAAAAIIGVAAGAILLFLALSHT